jgi:hypothetical protein
MRFWVMSAVTVMKNGEKLRGEEKDCLPLLGAAELSLAGDLKNVTVRTSHSYYRSQLMHGCCLLNTHMNQFVHTEPSTSLKYP